jgi:adenosylcobinamide-GDP ribazoletransferase
MNFLKRFAVTISYVTCIHVVKIEFDQESTVIRGLAKYLPAVGILIGLLLLAISAIMNFLESEALLKGCILSLAWLWLTGGLHFDGLMDTADGIFSHQVKERILEIMHDSRVGNFGVLAGVSILLIKVASIASLHGQALVAALICIPIWARWCETYAIGKFEYAREDGKGKVWHESTQHPLDLFKGAVPAAIASAIVAYTAGQAEVLCPLVLTVISGVIASHWLNAKVGGQTGDTYGAVVELAEAAGISLTAMLGPLLTGS